MKPSNLLILVILIGSIIVASLWTLTETVIMPEQIAIMIDNLSFLILKLTLLISAGLTLVVTVKGFGEWREE